jgi:hypothetical protein
MRRKFDQGESTGPATLGSTAKAHLVLHVWCWDCRHRADVELRRRSRARNRPDLPWTILNPKKSRPKFFASSISNCERRRLRDSRAPA